MPTMTITGATNLETPHTSTNIHKKIDDKKRENAYVIYVLIK